MRGYQKVAHGKKNEKKNLVKLSKSNSGAQKRFPTILAPDISAKDILAWTFHHRDISAHA